ncbi:unnamed protein product, partial [marine sediment metagenome]
MASEQAEEAWILGFYETRREAIIAEMVLQGKYGLPSATFEVTQRGHLLLTQDLHHIHNEISQQVSARVQALFADRGLDPAYPLYSRIEGHRVIRTGYAFETRAANLIPGLMEIPTLPDPQYQGHRHKPTWEPFSVAREHYRGQVYSLNVLPHGHYVSGGAIVHNSVKGMEADYVAVCPDMSKKTWLSWQRLPDEEKRVWYVAATRARQGLLLIHPESEYC